jgi:signal transduction histidine kinase
VRDARPGRACNLQKAEKTDAIAPRFTPDSVGYSTLTTTPQELLPQPSVVVGPEDLFPVGSEMATRMRAFDWAATPLGPVHTWPQSLRTAVRIVLTSRFAMWMGWGPDLTFFYNDAYARMTLGKKHPWALGRTAREVWAEIWRDIGPRIERVIETGTATWDEGLLLFLERSGYVEETYHTFSYSPLTDDATTVAGMLCVVTEETDRVIGSRRLASLRELGASLASVTAEADVIEGIRRGIGDNQRDIPFSLLYLYAGADGHDANGIRAQLAGATGIEPGHPAAAAEIRVGDSHAPWPAAALHAHPERIVIDDLAKRFDGIPTGAWDVAPHQAVVVPIAQAAHQRPAGFLVAATNPYRPLDEGYVGFIDLVAGQIAASLANARAHERERRRAESLAELDRAKTQFFSNVSHEFRTPLTLILGPTEDVLANPDTGPRNRASLEVIHRNAMRLLKLVNTLLDFSRIEAGRIDARYERTDLSKLTAELASSFRSVIEQAGLALELDCRPTTATVYVDRDMWEKIVLNLVSNAFKHTFDGTVTVALRERDGAAELVVRDTGIGISPDQIPRLFERFYRVPNVRSRTHEGTGIGLALVQELVRLHGGSITVDSVQGTGTSFTVRIPLGSAHLPADRVSSGDGGTIRVPTPASGVLAFTAEAQRWLPDDSDASIAGVRSDDGRARALDHARVLVVDDNADMRDYAARLLGAQGWIVDTAADGAAALAAARRDPPDLVLSDVMMPRLDGFGLLRALRADPRTSATPIILLSARAGEEARVEGLDTGADDYLVKPFSAQELVARVRSHLSLARVRTAASDAADRARRDAEAAREEAERANRAKSDFLAAMSHELRTPLNAIAGYVQLLEMGVHGPMSDSQREVLRRVQRSEHHLLSLINDVLNFVKIEAGRVEYDMRPVDLGAVVAAAAPIVEQQLQAKRIAFEQRVDSGTIVWADEDKLRQVLLNLLTNAVKFTEPGGRVTVDVAPTTGDADTVLLRVTDTGIGIPAEKQEAIFDPFIQVHRHFTRSTEGTGLGLSISRDLAHGMGAELRVESVVGKGSVFTLALRCRADGEPGTGNREP